MAGAVRWWMLLLLTVSAGAAAESLPDPTKPPVAFGAAPGIGAEDDGGLRLQSVMLPRDGRPMAVISGSTVRLGEKVGDGRLIRLTETEAVIKGPQGLQRLPLLPDVQKTPVGGKGAGKPSDKKKEKS